ncbi:MAG: phytanoyl-CoA dioxygenase family protein [Gammaproteobacteria bacterium]|nr:phytanoyl-CoA dioxygenase family protein [Gammaproteobacteria bacterium]
MFTPFEIETFAVSGLLKRENFLPAEKLRIAREVILQHLQRKGLWRDGAWHLDGWTQSTDYGTSMAIVKPLNRHQALIDLASGELAAAASALANGCPVFPMDQHPALLFTLPNSTQWSIPHKNWHLDMPRLPNRGVPGVQIFAFIETVEAGGGGTLAVTGSHLLHNEGVRIRSGDLRKKLKREPYFAELMSNNSDDRLHFLRDVGNVGDVALQFVEMTGEAGDVYFMDLRVLHTVAANALKRPRLMLTQRYLLESSRIALYGK